MIRATIRNLLILPLSFFAATSAPAQEEGNVDLPRYPSISPDGAHVTFSWRGDVWKVPASGGAALRMTSHPQDDLQSAWSRDGKRIAFLSNRAGSANLHMMNADGTGLRQVTDFDRPIALGAFGVDEQGNEVISLSSRPEPDWFPAARVYTVSTGGGDLAPIHNAYGTFAVISPDGSKVLFNRGGASWSRRHYRGSDTRDVWLYERATKSFKRLTSWAGNDGRARWLDDDTFVYASDRQDNTVNLYKLDVDQDERQAIRLTRFTDADVEDFDVSADGRTVVLAKWDKLYTLDLATSSAEPRPLVIRGSEDESDRYQLKDVSRAISEAALSPDGKTIAYITYGEVYVRGVEKNSPARRLTHSAARERDLAWSPDGMKLYYAGDASGIEAVYAATVKLSRSEVKKQYEDVKKKPKRATTQTATDETEAATAPATQASTQPSTQPTADASRWTEAVAFDVATVTTSDHGDREPSPSPDGKWLAFRRGVGNVMLMNLTTKEVKPLLENWSQSLEWRWSPDSRHVAYVTEDQNFNSDVWVVPVDGSAPAVNVTRHPDNDTSPRWSADGRILAFLSERVNNEDDVWMVWLDKDMEGLTAPELDQYYKDAAAAAKKREPLNAKKGATTKPSTQPATDENGEKDEADRRERAAADKDKKPARPPKEKLDLDDAYLRLRRVTTLPGDERSLELTPGGDKYIFVAAIGASPRAMYAMEREGAESKEPKKIGPGATVQHLSLTGDQVVIVEQGRGGVVKLDKPDAPEWLDVADKIRVDLAQQSSQKFLEAARILAFMYYDPKMNGLDWGAITRRYHGLAKAARTSDEFDHVAAKLLGELNGSHLGINSPDAPIPLSRPYGKLGIKSERVTSNVNGGGVGYKVTWVLPEGPADKSPTKLQVGDVIRSVDLEPIGEDETLDSKLAGKSEKEIVLSFVRTLEDGSARELTALVTPVPYARVADLFYDHWRLETAKKVSEWSNGQIGYIHVEGMSQPSLDVFERDLYAAADGKKALIIDVRNNGGGWTADRLLASITHPRHAFPVARGQPGDNKGYPHDRLFIQRFDGPVNMLCNEKSFSNAEIISHAFKTVKRGTLVGQQTAGGVISTGGTTLIDGTTVRIPFRGWFLPDGKNMENNGATPDIVVTQTPEDESRGYDAQLKAAVDDLMKRIK